MTESPLLYSTRLLDPFTKLIARQHAAVDIGAILTHARIMPWEIADTSHWLTAEQVNRFYEKALEALQPALAIDPRHPVALRQRLQLHLKLEDLPACDQDVEILKRAFPDKAEIFGDAAKVRAKQGREREALAEIGEALQRAPDTKEYLELKETLEKALASPGR